MTEIDSLRITALQLTTSSQESCQERLFTLVSFSWACQNQNTNDIDIRFDVLKPVLNNSIYEAYVEPLFFFFFQEILVVKKFLP